MISTLRVTTCQCTLLTCLIILNKCKQIHDDLRDSSQWTFDPFESIYFFGFFSLPVLFTSFLRCVTLNTDPFYMRRNRTKTLMNLLQKHDYLFWIIKKCCQTISIGKENNWTTTTKTTKSLGYGAAWKHMARCSTVNLEMKLLCSGKQFSITFLKIELKHLFQYTIETQFEGEISRMVLFLTSNQFAYQTIIEYLIGWAEKSNWD